MRRTYAAHLQCHHLPPVRKILHGPIAQVQVLSWLPEGKTQAYRCRPTGREALPCLIPTTSPPPFCSKNRAKRRLFFYTTLPNLRGKMRMPGCTVPRSMAAGTARTANTRLYQRMPWPPWYATGSPVPRLPGHVRKGWTSPSASSPTGMMTMAAAAGKHGCGCPLVDLDRWPAPGALRRRTRADAGRAAATYQQVSITNENRPLPSRRAGQRPVWQINVERCVNSKPVF